MSWTPVVPAPPPRPRFRRMVPWLGVAVIVPITVALAFWMAARRAEVVTARDGRAEAKASLARSRSSARHYEAELTESRDSAREVSSAAGRIVGLDQTDATLSGEYVALSRRAATRILDEDVDGHNRSLDEMRVIVDRQNALADEINALLPELTGEPIAPRPTPVRVDD